MRMYNDHIGSTSTPCCEKQHSMKPMHVGLISTTVSSSHAHGGYEFASLLPMMQPFHNFMFPLLLLPMEKSET